MRAVAVAGTATAYRIKTRQAAPEGLRIAAAEIERIVLSGIGDLLSNPGGLGEALGPHVDSAGEQQQVLTRASEVAASWSELPVAQLRPMVTMLSPRITLHSERIDIGKKAIRVPPGGTVCSGSGRHAGRAPAAAVVSDAALPHRPRQASRHRCGRQAGDRRHTGSQAG